MTTFIRARTDPRREAQRRPMRGRLGFSMLELIIVMIIIATLLAAAAPSLRGFYAKQQVTNLAGQIVALCNYAQQAARNEGRIYRFNLDVEQGIYGLTAQEGSEFFEPMHDLGMVFELPAEVRAYWMEMDLTASDRQYVTFYPSGRVEPAAIRLIGRRDQIMDVMCLSATGRFTALTEEESLALQERIKQGYRFSSRTSQIGSSSGTGKR